MLVTEEQAEEMWCPATRYVSEQSRNAAINRWVGDVDESYSPVPARCIASKCMWFRWMSDQTVVLKDDVTAIIDAQDAPALYDLSWWWDGRYVKGDNGYLHRWIVTRRIGEIPDGMHVDHIDGDPLNNRFGNLRLCEPHQNSANARSRGGKSAYRGVFRQASGRWAAQISSRGNRICLGTYDTEEEAAEAYDQAALAIHGEFAKLNLTGPVLNSGRLGYCGLAGKP